MSGLGGLGGLGGGFLSEMMGAIAAVMIIIGVLECYFGYIIFKIQLIIVGFVFGVLVGVGLVGVAMEAGVGVGILVGVLLGVLFAFLSVKVYFLGVFIFVATLSGVAAFLMTSGDHPVLSVLVAIVMGVLGAIIEKHLIIITTSLSGGVAIGMGLMSMMKQEMGIGLLLSALAAGTGLYVQYKFAAKKTPAAQAGPSPQAVPDSPNAPKPERKLPDMSAIKSKLPDMSDIKAKMPDMSEMKSKLPDVSALKDKTKSLIQPSGGAQPSAPGLHCPACGKALPLGAGFCNGCGHNLNAAQAPAPAPFDAGKACPSCGKLLPADAGFCGACGNTLSQ